MSLYTRERARRSMFHTAAFRIISQCATIIGYVVMVRGMSEHDFGVFHLLYAIIPLISAGASLGLEQVLMRYQPEFLSQNRKPAAAWLVKFVSSARFGINLVVLGLIFASWHVITPLFKLEPYREEFLFFSVLILLYFQFRLLEISLSSHMLHKYSIGMQAGLALIKLAGYASFTMLGSLSVQNAILTDTLAYGLGFSALYVIHRRLSAAGPKLHSPPLSKEERKRLFRYGLFYNFNDAGTLTLNAKIDNFYIAAILDPIAVGVYSFYLRLSLMVNRVLPIRLFQNVVRPVFFATPQDQAAQRIPAYFTLLLNTSLVVQIPLTAFALSFHTEIVSFIFGDKYISYSWLLPLTMLFATLNTIAIPVTLAAQYAERAAIILMSKIFGIYNIIALLALIPALGVYGAVIASGSGSLLKNLFIWWHVRDIARWKNSRSMIFATIGYWGVFFMLTLIIRSAAAWPTWATLAVGGILWVVFILAFLRSQALTESDRKILGGVMRGRERRILQRLGLVH